MVEIASCCGFQEKFTLFKTEQSIEVKDRPVPLAQVVHKLKSYLNCTPPDSFTQIDMTRCKDEHTQGEFSGLAHIANGADANPCFAGSY